MKRERQARAVAVLVGAALAMAGVTAGARAQNLSPAEAATRLSGTWVLNKELTSGFRAPGGDAAAVAAGACAWPWRRRSATWGGSRRRRTRATSARRSRRDGGDARAAAAGRGHHHQGDAGAGGVRGCARPAELRARWQERQGHGRRRGGEHQVAVGQGRPQAGILDGIEQADPDVGGRRERPAGARRQGGEPAAQDARPEGRIRQEAVRIGWSRSTAPATCSAPAASRRAA